MTVVGPATRLLFCEGHPRSYDARLLTRLLVGRSRTLVVPAGGKHGLRAFVDGYLASHGPSHFLGFRDRDFDLQPGPTPALLQLSGSKPIYLSHRACIENYLLDAALIDAYWATHHRVSSTWSHGPSPGVADIQTWVSDAARELVTYQATRWALASLKPGERWPEITTTWTTGSGHLPSSLTHAACVAAATALVSSYVTLSSSITPAAFNSHFASFHAQFSAASFLPAHDYLVWFHGKDLIAEMQRLRPNSISLRHFCSWAVDHVGWSAYPDLQELASKI